MRIGLPMGAGRSTGERATFLGVERSALGCRWTHSLSPRGEARALEIAQRHGLPDLVARLLSARGVQPDDVARFLAPRIRDLMPDPSTLTDMDRAAARIADAIESREAVAIFGDYDVDGAASSAMMARYLAHFGVAAPIRIPDRITEGYGPNPAAMSELAAAGATLIVAVDCGTTSLDALRAAKEAGADVVVLDHHQTGPELPAACAIVNPNRQDDLSGQGHLCAAGVVFLALAAVSRELRARGRVAVPNLLGLVDLAALATVCDVVPLVGFNRALVAQGLQATRGRANAGIAALGRVARLSGPLDTYHLGFLIGPRINAGGRIGDAALGSRLLATDDEAEAGQIAEELHLLNEQRQSLERAMLAEAEAEIRAEIGDGEGPAVLVVTREAWHPGLVGLIAARLKESFRRPAFAIAIDRNGRGSGSGRSVPGFDIGALVRKAVEAGILAKGGGHAMAAGLTLDRARLADFRAFVETLTDAQIATLRKPGERLVDGAISAGGLTVDLVRTLDHAGPYGAGHERPVVALPRHRIVSAQPIGQGGHIRAMLRAADGSQVSAIAFRAVGSPLEAPLLQAGGALLHVAGSVSIDHFRGTEKVSFRIVDVAGAFD